MYVCLCRGVTDRHIRHAVNEGAARMRDLNRTLGVCSQCGKCGKHALEILEGSLKALGTPPGRLADMTRAAARPA